MILKGTKRQLTNMNQAMMEMLRGRAVGVAAAIGGVGGAARSTVELRPVGGGGGVAE
jgi:hypothetical protein